MNYSLPIQSSTSKSRRCQNQEMHFGTDSNTGLCENDKSMKVDKDETSSIVSLFARDSRTITNSKASDISSLVNQDVQSQDIFDTDVCITECGGIQLAGEIVQQYSDKPIVSLFEMSESRYIINDLPKSVHEDPNLVPLSSFLHQQAHGYTYSNPDQEAATVVLQSIDEINHSSSLKNPDAHRKSLFQLASRLKESNGSQTISSPFLTPHFLIKGLIKGLPDTALWIEKAIAHFSQVVEAYENQYSADQDDTVTPSKNKVTLSIYLETKQVLGQIRKVKNLLELSKQESADSENQFNKFVLRALKSQIPGRHKDQAHYATVSDGNFLLQILQRQSIGQLMIKTEIEDIFEETMVSSKRLQNECIAHNDIANAKLFRKIAYRDYRRMQFEKLMKEKTAASITRICKGFVSEQYMWPYSCVFTAPLLRLPATWQSVDFPLVLQHAVVRSYETQRLSKSALRYANGGSTILRDGKLTFRRTNRQTLLLLEGNVFPKSEAAIDNIWKMRSNSSIVNFSEQDYYKLLSDIDEGQIKCVLRPITTRQDIRQRVKMFREMCTKNRDIVKRRACIDEEQTDSASDEDSPATETVVQDEKESSDDANTENHLSEVNRNYEPNKHLDKSAIHKQILAKLALRHPDTFKDYLKPIMLANHEAHWKDNIQKTRDQSISHAQERHDESIVEY